MLKETVMKKITMLHTVKSVYCTFPTMLEKALGEDVRITNIVDEFLISNTQREGYFTRYNRERLLSDMRLADEEKSDLLVVTCSSLTPYVLDLQKSIRTPLVTIDVDMCRKAAEEGRVITVLATAPTAVAPVLNRIEENLKAMGKTAGVTSALTEDAMTALKRGDTDTHDNLLVSLAESFPDTDLFVLAQASMVTAQRKIEKATGKKVLSSPESCIEEVVRFYRKRENQNAL